jgi:sulfur-oxidizing protein SoxY
MAMMRRRCFGRNVMNLWLKLALAGALFVPLAVRAEDDAAARAARWQDLRHEVFGDRQVRDGADKITLDAPDRAEDAALVPVTITVANPKDVRGVYLVIDDNPAPMAAHVIFGPAGDPRMLKLRVRVNQYTNMHAIEETNAGDLYETARFLKASGGCSAPAGSYDEQALREVGQMRFRAARALGQDGPVEAQLLIRHPNFNGMQMDQQTRGYTPARFLKTITATYNGQKVWDIDSDISLSTDPAITFLVKAQKKGTLEVTAKDSDAAVFLHSFELDQPGS